MGTTLTLLLAQVLVFSLWPFLIIRSAPATRIVLFQVAIGVLLMIAGVLGAVYALRVGPVQLSLGNIAYAAVIMTSVAMFAATRDPKVIRDAVRLVLAINLVNLGVLALTAQALRLPDTVATVGIPPEAFSISIRSAVIGGVLHIVQLLLLAVVMERIRRSIAAPTAVGAVTIVAFLAALALDGAAFPAVVTVVEPELVALLSAGWSGVLAKLLLGLLYAVPLAAFLFVHQHQHEAVADDADLRGLLFATRGELLETVARTVEEREELHTRLGDVVGAITDGVCGLDEDWRLTFINTSAAAVVGEPAQALIGRSLWEILPHTLGTEVEGLLRRVVDTGAPETLLTDVLVPDRITELRVYPGRHCLVAYAHDVTGRVQAQRRLEGVVRAEQAAAERLREVDQLKNTFLTAVSHELRTPLTVVLGLAETLQRLSATEVDPYARTQIETALVANSLRLGQLLDDLLDVDRLVRGVVVVEPDGCDVAALVRASVDAHPASGRIHARLPDRLRAEVDAPRLERIVVNLLDNAAKYAPDGDIEVALTSDGSQLRLEVTDAGPGIPPEELEQVFVAFHRIDEHHPQPGTGIGLALVREFSQLHAGRAWAVDTEGGGAHLCVELPLVATSGVPDS